MSLKAHICANKSWGGAETRAQLSAISDGESSVVICADSDGVFQRMRSKGVTAYRCKMSGIFAVVNLSRVLRHLPEDECIIVVHSPEIRGMVQSAINLSGHRSLTLSDGYEMPEFPTVALGKASGDDGVVLLWIGRITPDCGLSALIDALGHFAEKDNWRLKVYGEGDAKVAMPLVNRTRALGIDKQVEWGGYVTDVYGVMNGARCGIVTRVNPDSRTVTREFAAAGLPVICGSDVDTLRKQIADLI